MTTHTTSLTRGALGAVALLTLAACGSSGAYGGSGSPSPASSPATSTGAGSGGGGVHVAGTSLGKVLVDGSGRTLYLLTADKPGHSTCDASCLQYWPAVVPGGPPSGVTAKVGSTTTTDGGTTVTVAGWPLYTFAQDARPGQVTGEGVKSFGGVWWAISPSGQPVKGAAGAGGTHAGGGY